MTCGQRAGMHFLLDVNGENRIGRGTECKIVLTDPLCSRVHAIVERQDQVWRIRDAHSRNGTFVNGQKVDEAVLADGHYVRVGGTEFAFHCEEQPPQQGPISDLNITQTVVRDARVGDFDSSYFAVSALRDHEHAHDLLLLYQLSLKLLGCGDAQQLLKIALDLLYSRTKASLVGFLWIDDEGQLQPKMVVPERPKEPVQLNETLTRLVSQEAHAIWIASQQSPHAKNALEHYADALCVPLMDQDDQKVLGAMHVYRERGRFSQMHFDFAISLANITAVALRRALRQETLETNFRRLREKSPGYDELIGQCPAMLELKSKISRLGKASGSVLVRGESGTGKELVARALHRASSRADRPMLAVNCAAIPPDLIDSQLFGHKAGSFTGADRDHVGYFEQADLGTLFLDEVGEMPLAAQSKLLRILEGHPFLPVGGVEEITVDVRVIAATNRDLLNFVREKKFREDLYYRLSVFELTAPPLRERGKDVGLLIDYFLEHFLRQHGRPGLKLADDARQRLLDYSWPGNVRQLRNVIDSAVVLASEDTILPGDLGLRDTSQMELDTLRIEDWERKLIAEALKRTAGNVPEAAKLLGIARATLYRKIEEYGIGKDGRGST